MGGQSRPGVCDHGVILTTIEYKYFPWMLVLRKKNIILICLKLDSRRYEDAYLAKNKLHLRVINSITLYLRRIVDDVPIVVGNIYGFLSLYVHIVIFAYES